MKYRFVGWCHEENHDKVWGVIQLSENGVGENHVMSEKFCTFWGRRGAKLQTKVWDAFPWELAHMFDQKMNRGYTKISPGQLSQIYPEFEDDLKKTAMWAVLTN